MKYKHMNKWMCEPTQINGLGILPQLTFTITYVLILLFHYWFGMTPNWHNHLQWLFMHLYNNTVWHFFLSWIFLVIGS
jgi:hypothetical protein